MNAPARYLFDLDFNAPEKPEVVEETVPMITVYEHEAHVKEAERRAHLKGVEEGKRSAEAEAARRAAAETARIAEATERLLGAIDHERVEREAAALSLALTVARKLAPALIEMNPRAEIEALIADALRPLSKTPHLVVRLAAEDAEALDATLSAMAREKGFAGRLVVLGEDSMARGDCRIEWADGGIVRERATIDAEIDRLVETYIEARRAETKSGGGAAGEGASS
ncbi:MAG: flagellar assembly protein FliH [Hyphomicrobiaceae bacterium]|nr:flagellar assembly protein FliH [Hyphomicrobiaceae bacterium]